MTGTADCPLCTKYRRCGKPHLYVIELDYALTRNRRFMRGNPLYKSGRDCLYVGSTSHTPRCRFLQHQLHANKRELGYYCRCDGGEVFHEFLRGGGKTRGSYYPGVYGLRLRPDLHYTLNPLPHAKNCAEMEEKLAVFLRRKGFAVWQH